MTRDEGAAVKSSRAARAGKAGGRAQTFKSFSFRAERASEQISLETERVQRAHGSSSVAVHARGRRYDEDDAINTSRAQTNTLSLNSLTR